MEDNLRAGVAVYNAGYYHAAHDAWEARWLSLESGSEDERFLHGLIQFTAAVHHAHRGNWVGTHGLAASAVGYLDGLSPDYRGVNVGTVREYLRAVRTDPEHVERCSAPALTIEGRALGLAELQYPAIGTAATVLAEELNGYDEAVIERAVEFADEAFNARAAGEAGGDDRFLTLLSDFVQDPVHRDVVYHRLEGHVDKRVAELEDVDGLFD